MAACRRLSSEALTRNEIEHRVTTRLTRKIVVVGACTGSDAHTVGIDAILNYKGDPGEPDHHAAQLPQGERAGAHRARKEAGLAEQDRDAARRPTIDHKLALELGFDSGTKPSDVASFLVERMCGDREKAGAAMAAAGETP